MYIAPAILRLKPEPDVSQQQVIGHMDGPMLVIAGPGSGKTGSIQLRAVNLLLTGRPTPVSWCSVPSAGTRPGSCNGASPRRRWRAGRQETSPG